MKFKITVFFLFSLFFSLSTFSQSLITGSFVYQSINRTYLLYVPAIYNPSIAVPLVMNFHGYSSNSTQQMVYGEFRPIADTANFIIVCPNGTLDPNNFQYWNNFNAPGGPDDIGFASALIDTIEAHYNIDHNCIYSTGMSNGGFMSYDLAYLLSNRIAAIASVTGDMIYSHINACHPIHPTPVMQIHGTNDATVLFSGDANFEPIDSLVNFWVQFNHCNPVPSFTNLPNINLADSCTAEHYVYSGGDSSATVEFYKIIGGGHSWPGALVNINITNMDFNASVEIWRFFRKYKLNQLSNGIHPEQAEIKIPIYPNPSNGNFILIFKDDAKRTITITDGLGQIVQTLSCSSKEENIYIENTGIYFITILQDNKTWTQKIMRN